MIAHKLLVQQFDEFRTAHFDAGGKRKGLKYPEGLRRGAATYVRSLPLANYSDVAAEFGVDGAALKAWADALPKSSIPAAKIMPAFLPVAVEERQTAPVPALANRKSVVITCRHIKLDLGDESSELTLKMLISALEASHGGASL